MRFTRTLALGIALTLSSCGLGGARTAVLQPVGGPFLISKTTKAAPPTLKRRKAAAHRKMIQARHKAAVHRAAVLQARKRWFRALQLNAFYAAIAAIPGNRAVATARAQLGKPYVYAGSGPNVFDCSGLTMYAWGSAGVSIPHNAAAQYYSERHVDRDRLAPGDLVFFGSSIHHVGIYVGNGTMIESPHSGAYVQYSTIYRQDYAGASSPR